MREQIDWDAVARVAPRSRRSRGRSCPARTSSTVDVPERSPRAMSKRAAAVRRRRGVQRDALRERRARGGARHRRCAIVGHDVFLTGQVATPTGATPRDHVRRTTSRPNTRCTTSSRCSPVAEAPPAAGGDAHVIRVAAVGDVHMAADDPAGSLARASQPCPSTPTCCCSPATSPARRRRGELQVLLDELDAAAVPIVAVLGNHDYRVRPRRGSSSKLLERAACTCSRATAT